MRIVAALGCNSWLFALTSDGLTPVVDLQIPAADAWIRIDGGIAAIVRGQASVFLFEHERDRVKTDILKLPPGADPCSIAAWNDWIFVAGRGGHVPMLVMGRWRDEVSIWRSIYPESLAKFGHRKKIGALFTWGDRLIAVDNIVTPKFLAVFGVTAEGVGEPELLELQGHGSYETIHSAALTFGRLALLSTTGSMTGRGFYVSIVDPLTAEEVALFESFRRPEFLERDAARDKFPVATRLLQSAQSVALLGDILIIACGREGLGLARLSPRSRRAERRRGAGNTAVLNADLRSYRPGELAMTEQVAVRAFQECDGVLITCSDARGGYKPIFVRGDVLRLALE
jgi:hypothetical protein